MQKDLEHEIRDLKKELQTEREGAVECLRTADTKINSQLKETFRNSHKFQQKLCTEKVKYTKSI